MKPLLDKPGPAAPDEDSAYLDNACMGKPSREALAGVHALLERVSRAATPPTELVVEMHRQYERARAAVAGLVGALPSQIALVESTTHGLCLVAESLPLLPGDNVLVPELEFFPPVLAWRTRTAAGEVEVRAVAAPGGRLEVESFAAQLDGRTRALVFSSVQEINGFRAEVRALVDLAHQHGALVVIDGVQEVGCLAVDLPALGVDAYCAGGHKWLRNPCGMGFLYLSEELAARLEPATFGYFAAADPPGGWESYLASPTRTAFDELAFRPDASRFEVGGFGNYPGATTLAATVEEMLQLGPRRVEDRVLQLTQRLRQGAASLGLEIRSAGEPHHLSGITCVGLPGGAEEEQRAARWLREHGIFVSVRYTAGTGGIRVSPHHYNTACEIDRLLDALDSWTKGEH